MRGTGADISAAVCGSVRLCRFLDAHLSAQHAAERGAGRGSVRGYLSDGERPGARRFDPASSSTERSGTAGRRGGSGKHQHRLLLAHGPDRRGDGWGQQRAGECGGGFGSEFHMVVDSPSERRIQPRLLFEISAPDFGLVGGSDGEPAGGNPFAAGALSRGDYFETAAQKQQQQERQHDDRVRARGLVRNAPAALRI